MGQRRTRANSSKEVADLATGSQPDTVQGVVLWEAGEISCVCVTLAADHIEIIIAGGTTVTRDVFVDTESAATFAIDKMHTYNAR
jgi:hypothetical protein